MGLNARVFANMTGLGPLCQPPHIVFPRWPFCLFVCFLPNLKKIKQNSLEIKSHYMARAVWSAVSSCFCLLESAGVCTAMPRPHWPPPYLMVIVTQRGKAHHSHTPRLLQACSLSPSHRPLSPSVSPCCRSHTWSALPWHWSSQEADAAGLMPLFTVLCG